MRHLGRLAGSFVVAIACWSLAGCGDEGSEAGVPKNIDMTKDYTPAATADMMSPKDMKSGASKAAKATGAPLAPK